MADKLVRRLEATKLMKGLADNFWTDVKQARQKGTVVGWTCGPVPFPELLYSMDIRVVHLESYGAFVAARQAHGELKDVAHAAGYSPDVCSYARIVHGRRILEERGELSRMRDDVVYPTPDFVSGISTCPTMLFAADSFARTYHVPLFFFELPNWTKQAEEKEMRVYFRHQIEDFIHFLEDLTHRKFDYDQFRGRLKLAREASALRMRCLELCKNVPSPMTAFDQFISLGPMNYLRGTPQSVTFYQALLAEVEDRAAKKIGAIADERYRLYWDNLAIWFKVGALSEKLASLKANLIIGQYTFFLFNRPHIINPDDPIGTLVEEYVGFLASRSLEWRINLVSRFVQEYSLDGMLMHSSRTCRPFDFGQHDIIEAVQRRTGVPGLMIDGDPTDPNYYSDAQVNTRLEAFMETLAARKKRLAA